MTLDIPTLIRPRPETTNPTHLRTIKLRVPVRGDVEAVARWWADPARHLELRSEYDGPWGGGLTWSESSDGAHLVEEGEWSTAKRGVWIRITTTLGPDGTSVQRRADGSFVRKQDLRQVRSSHAGREHVAVSVRHMELTESAPGQTTLTSTVTVQRTGFHWWERATLRNEELQHRVTPLQQWVARCESDIAAEGASAR